MASIYKDKSRHCMEPATAFPVTTRSHRCFAAARKWDAHPRCASVVKRRPQEGYVHRAHKQTDRETERQTHTHTATQRQRHRQAGRQTQTETDRDRQRQRQP